MTKYAASLTSRDGVVHHVVAWLAIGLCGACVGTGEGVPFVDPNASTAPTTFEEIYTMIFDPMCTQPCHRGGAAPKGLSMESNRVIASLVGVPSVEAPGMLRVAPGVPDESYLVVKLAATDRRRVGSRMPRNGPPFVTGAQLRSVKRWIKAGATKDWVDQPDIDGGPADAALPDADPTDADPTDADPTDADPTDAEMM